MTAGFKKNGDENAASLCAAMTIEEYVHGKRLERDDAFDTDAIVEVYTGGRSNESTSQRHESQLTEVTPERPLE